MQRRLDATVTHLITMETTGVRERMVSHSSIDYFATLSLSVCMKVDFRTENFHGLLAFAVPKESTPKNFVEKTFCK